MENGFKPLECNDDVLSFEDNNNLFQVGKFKLKIENDIRKKFDFLYETRKNNYQEDYIIDYLREVFIQGLKINDAYMNLECIFPKEGINCERLILGSKNWQNGKLRIRAYIESSYDENEGEENLNVKINLEFSPDEPEITEPESPLDDIRRMIKEVST
ncbi:KGK domain-containing protein [Tolypothrix sp. VBCCA 56010]|uniref:KGK domain-containing protein n=1 Tax=Tolypothrix sp. VBCCA 56010 TaxID=3137731 RepID=UPI003D7DC34A